MANKCKRNNKSQGVISPLQLGKRKLWLPQMSYHAFALKTALNRQGIKTDVLPKTTQNSLYLAREQLGGDQCLPCQTTLGDFLRRAKEKDFRQEKEAFFQGSATGPCRYGQYIHLQRQVLDNLNCTKVPIVTLSNQNAYSGLGSRFKTDVMLGMIATEYLYKLVWRTRPYETKPLSDKLMHKYVQLLESTPPTAIRKLLANAVREFRAVPTVRKPRPLIGIVGEIYVRLNDFCNQDLVRRVEEQGGEAWVSPFFEWFEYMIESRKKEAKEYNRYLAQEKTVKFIKWFLWQPLKEYLKGRFDNYVSEAMSYGSRYVDPQFEGETILTLGKSVEFYHAGASGIINAGPFACMPSTIVSQISRSLRKDCKNIPFLNIAFDGNVQDSQQVMLNAFMHQCRAYR